MKNLTVSYDHFSALWDINFEIACGQIVGIIGPNGAGKSTLIKAIIGLIKPISGGAELCKIDIKKNRKRVAYVPQKKGIDWQFPITAFDVVLMGCYGRLKGLKWCNRSERNRAFHLLELMHMEKLGNRQIGALSVGQQQRLFVARALMQDADLFLLDEPFAGVDKTTETLIMKIMTDLKTEGKTILIVHHDLNTVEAYFDALVILKTSLIAYGSTKAVFHLENLNRAYGAKGVIFDEALRLSLAQSAGLR